MVDEWLRFVGYLGAFVVLVAATTYGGMIWRAYKATRGKLSANSARK